MKIYFCIAFLYITCFCVQAQNTDSLLNEMSESTEEKQTELYNKLASIYLKKDNKKAIYYASKAREISQTNEYELSFANANLILGDAYSNRGNYNQAKLYFNEAINSFEEFSNDEKLATCYYKLGKLEFVSGILDQALQNLKMALELREKLPLDSKLGNSYMMLGIVYGALHRFGLAEEYLMEAVNVHSQLNNNRALSIAYNNLGMVFSERNEYDKSLEWYINALKLKEEAGDSLSMANTIENIGIIYLEIGKYELALKNLKEAYRIKHDRQIKNGVASTLNNLGVCYVELQNYDKAIEYYYESIRIKREFNDSVGVAHTLNNIGNLYDKQDKVQKALAVFHESAVIKKRLQDSVSLSETLANIGKAYLRIKQFSKSFKNLTDAKNIAEKYDVPGIKKNIYEGLTDYYYAKAQYKKAFHYQWLTQQTKDSILDMESAQAIAELQTKYDTEKKDRENQLLRKNDTIQKLEIARQRHFVLYLIIFSGFVVLVVLWALRGSRQKRKANERLLEMNKTILEQQEELQQSLDKLQELNDTKDKFFSIIAHDLKNPFNLILGFSDLLKIRYERLPEEKRKMYIQEINSASRLSYKLLNNLLIWARSQQDGIELLPEKFNIRLLCLESIEAYIPAAEKKGIQTDVKVPEKLTATFDWYTISTTIANLFNNAVKYTYPNGKIIIDAREEKDKVIIQIIDNGTGIDPELLSDLFSVGGNTSVEGTQKEQGTGLGLILCKEFVEKNKGEISAESEFGKGSTFTIMLPVSNS